VAALVDALAQPDVAGVELDVQFDRAGQPVLSHDKPRRGEQCAHLEAIRYLIDEHAAKLWLIEIKQCLWSIDRVSVIRPALLAYRDTVVIISFSKPIVELLGVHGFRTALIERADNTYKISLPDNLGVAWVRRDHGEYNIC
jgi:glycerophosphoryl diester phosphodiesterase